MTGFEKLKEIGAQKIHEKTHITKQHVQAVLHESFENINRVQFIGFISILEREYEIELDDLKAKGLAYFKEESSRLDSIDFAENTKNIFIYPKKKRNLTPLYITIILLIFAVAAYFSLTPLSSISKSLNIQQIDNSAIENAKNNITSMQQEAVNDENGSILDTNSSEKDNISIHFTEPKIIESEITETKIIDTKVIEPNSTKTEIIEQKTVEQKIDQEEVTEIIKSFKIFPKAKLWLGYIDLQTFKKYQNVSSDKFDLDPNRDWLLSLGHGHVDIEINGEIKKFKDRKNIRLLYKDGKLTKIDFEKFKSLNKGSGW